MNIENKSGNPTTDIAWAAGFIDGEGYIGINPYTSRGYQLYSLALRANQVDPRPLQKLRLLFGGTVNRLKLYPNRRQAWEWRVTGPRAERALRQMFPYLTVKQEQAQVALNYRFMVGPTGKPSKISRGLMDIFIKQLKELKEREW